MSSLSPAVQEPASTGEDTQPGGAEALPAHPLGAGRPPAEPGEVPLRVLAGPGYP